MRHAARTIRHATVPAATRRVARSALPRSRSRCSAAWRCRCRRRHARTSGPTPTAASSIRTSRHPATSRPRSSQGAPPPANPNAVKEPGGAGGRVQEAPARRGGKREEVGNAARRRGQAQPSMCTRAQAQIKQLAAEQIVPRPLQREGRGVYVDDADAPRGARRSWRSGSRRTARDQACQALRARARAESATRRRRTVTAPAASGRRRPSASVATPARRCPRRFVTSCRDSPG